MINPAPDPSDLDDLESRLAPILERFDETLARPDRGEADPLLTTPLPQFHPDLHELGTDLCECLQELEQVRREADLESFMPGDWLSGDSSQVPIPKAATRPAGIPVGDPFPHASSGTPQFPFRLRNFQVLRELGRGGHGIVYLAFDLKILRYVAIKHPLPEILNDPRRIERFLLESRAAGMLNHPNIVRVLEVGEDHLLPYIVTEYVSGPNLAVWLAGQQGPVDPRLSARIIRDLARGVHHAHEHGVIHRDIKPGNVILQRSQDSRPLPTEFPLIPRLTDFGVARVESLVGLTRTGEMMGTPAYLSPEQARGEVNNVDPRSDIFSLGTLLYELLTGHGAFVGENELSILTLVSKAELVPLRRRIPALPRDLDAICRKCLALEPSERYISAEALAEDLQRFLEGCPVRARHGSSLRRFGKWCRRSPLLASALITSFLLLVALIGVSQWLNHGIRSALDLAREHQRIAENRADQLDREAYLGDLKKAGEAWNNNHLDTVLPLLNRYLPQPGTKDLRDFGWWYLWNSIQDASRVIGTHTGGATAAVCTQSRDSIAATAGGDAVIKLWSLPEGKPIGELRGHAPGAIESLELSPDERLLLSAGNDGTVRVWDLKQRKQKIVLTGHQGWVAVARFSPDGKVIASGGADKLIRLWNAETGEQIGALEGHTDTVRSLGFHPQREWLVSSSEDKTSRLWNWKQRVPEDRGGTLPEARLRGGPENWGGRVEFDPDGSDVMIADVGVWSTAEANFGEFLTDFDSDGPRVRVARSLPDGRVILARQDSIIRISGKMNSWGDLGKTSNILRGHPLGPVNDFAVLPDDRGILSVCGNGEIRLWSSAAIQGDILLNKEGVRAPWALYWRGNYVQYVINREKYGTEFGTVRMSDRRILGVWGNDNNVKTGQMGIFTNNENRYLGVRRDQLVEYRLPRRGFEWGVEALEPTEQLEVDATGEFGCIRSDRRLRIVAMNDGKVLVDFNSPKGLSNCVILAQHRQLAVGCDDGNLYRWNLDEPLDGTSEIHTLRTSVNFDRLALSTDERFLAANYGDHTTVVYTYPELKEVARYLHQNWLCSAVGFVNEGRTLVFQEADSGRLDFWDWKSGRITLSLDLPESREFDISPDGMQLAFETERGIRIFDGKPRTSSMR